LVERPGAKSGPQLSRALTRLGPAYLKLGQFLATRPDVVGVIMARELGLPFAVGCPNSCDFRVSVDCKLSQRPLWFYLTYEWVDASSISKDPVEPC